VVAREDDDLRAQPFGHGVGGAVRELAFGPGAGSDHDAGGRRAQRLEVVLVVRRADDVLAEQRVVPRALVLRRQPEHGGIHRRLFREVGGDRPL
jgi:hypothetical protein